MSSVMPLLTAHPARCYRLRQAEGGGGRALTSNAGIVPISRYPPPAGAAAILMFIYDVSRDPSRGALLRGVDCGAEPARRGVASAGGTGLSSPFGWRCQVPAAGQ